MSQTKPPFFGEAEPAWEIAQLFPAQGEWTEEDYLTLDTNRLVEYSHGRVEVLIMPTELHQDLLLWLYEMLKRFVSADKLGKVMLAPRPVQLWPGKFREPDILFMLAENDMRRTQPYWIGADLVMEIISPDDRKRDETDKRREYAQANFPEYWLIDPERKTVVVLWLEGNSYQEHGLFSPGDQATSRLLPGFTVDVNALFAAAEM
jgi:Uma2 family endonuclease